VHCCCPEPNAALEATFIQISPTLAVLHSSPKKCNKPWDSDPVEDRNTVSLIMFQVVTLPYSQHEFPKLSICSKDAFLVGELVWEK